MKKAFVSWLLAALTILVNPVKAAVYYWDPEGSATPSAANLAATWNTTSSQWSSSSGQTASPVAWASGDAANFSAGTVTVTTPFVVTVNSTITIGGIYNGGLAPPGNFVSLNGTGALNLASGADAFDASGSDGGTTTINIPLIGPGQIALEGAAKLYLNGTNSFSGGTSIGYPGVPAFSSTLTFGNGYAFGTGPIEMNANGAGATLQMGGTGAMTVTNAFAVANVGLNINATPPGLILSGPWNLSATPFIGAGGPGLLTISGVMSGAGGFTKYGAGTLVLSGANTYTGITTVSNGTLSITADNNLGAVPSVANYIVDLDGGTLNASNTFTLNSNRLISLATIDTISVATGKTLTYAGTIGGFAGLIKSGAGTLALGGVSSYSGTTTISAGTLEADCQSGSTTSTNAVSLSAGGTLTGMGLISGTVTGAGKIAPGTPAGPATLTLGNGLNLSSGGTYAWNLFTNGTSGGFAALTLNGGNLTLGGSSKLSVNFGGTATLPNTNDAFWLAPEAWPSIAENGTAGNLNATHFASVVNGNYTAGNFTNYATASGLTLLYLPSFAYFDALSDDGPGFFSGENLILTNFSGLSLYVWSSTNAALPVNQWNLEGEMAEQSLAPGQPGYSRYSINVNPLASPTYYAAGNLNTGPYLPTSVTVSVLTTPDYVNFTVADTNVAIIASGRLGLVPFPPVLAPGNFDALGEYQVQFSAQTNVDYVIQASPDLVNWTNVTSGSVFSSPVTFNDSSATNYSTRFYRVLLP